MIATFLNNEQLIVEVLQPLHRSRKETAYKILARGQLIELIDLNYQYLAIAGIADDETKMINVVAIRNVVKTRRNITDKDSRIIIKTSSKKLTEAPEGLKLIALTGIGETYLGRPTQVKILWEASPQVINLPQTEKSDILTIAPNIQKVRSIRINNRLISDKISLY